MTNRAQSTDVNLRVFDLLEALTGDVPCYASPTWIVSDKKEAANARPFKGKRAG